MAAGRYWRVLVIASNAVFVYRLLPWISLNLHSSPQLWTANNGVLTVPNSASCKNTLIKLL